MLMRKMVKASVLRNALKQNYRPVQALRVE